MQNRQINQQKLVVIIIEQSQKGGKSINWGSLHELYEHVCLKDKMMHSA